jgi:hypothetical protein
MFGSAFASETCVAMKDLKVGYGSDLKYHIFCEGEKFETKRIITGILIPLPYNLGKVARARLNELMGERGQEEKMVFHGGDKLKKSDDIPYRVFKPKGSIIEEVCAVSYGNEKLIGSDKKPVYDFIIKCSSGQHSRTDYGANGEFLSGYSLEESRSVLTAKGFVQTLEFRPFKRKSWLYSATAKLTIKKVSTIIFEK